jgi:hypothetical protein
LLRVIQSVLAAAPKLKLHLFKSSNNQELFVAPPEAGRYSGEANLAKYWGWIDEVGGHSCCQAAALFVGCLKSLWQSNNVCIPALMVACTKLVVLGKALMLT